jgi:hypothetical protein
MNSTVMDKLEPLVSGKCKRPRCFKNLQCLLCNYHHNKQAWMMGDVFESGFYILKENEGREVKSSYH